MGKSVLIIIPHYRMRALLYAFRKAFEQPIITIFLHGHLESRVDVRPEEFQEIGPTYSMPRFYEEVAPKLKKMGMEELNELQKSLEEHLNVRRNGLTVSSDRNFRNVADYRTARELQVCQMLLAKRIFEENDISAVLTGREDYLRNVLAEYALSRDIPVLEVVHVRQCGTRLAGQDSKGQYVGLEGLFRDLHDKGTGGFPQEILEAADRHYEEFLHRPTLPSYVSLTSRSFLGSLAKALLSGTRSLAENSRLYRACAYDRTSGELAPTSRVLAHWPLKALRMGILEYTDFLTKSLPSGEKFLYLPLHLSPECVDMFYGQDYSLHEPFVMELARRIPSDYCLYVKENPSMVGQRPLGFYSRLKAIHNVRLLHYSINTFELMSKCAAVVTVTGTAGWEAYLMNRPVVVLGNVFYNFLPGVLHMSMYGEDFAARVRGYIESFRPDPSERRNAMRGCFLCSLELGTPIGMGDMGGEQIAGNKQAEIVREILRYAQNPAGPVPGAGVGT